MNGEKRPHHVVEDHLHIFGMDRTYVRWVYHGEPYNDPSAGEADLAHTMDGREGEKKRLLQETGFSSGTCVVPDEKKHRVEEVSQFDGRFEDESQFDALWMSLLILNVSFVSLYRKGKTSIGGGGGGNGALKPLRLYSSGCKMRLLMKLLCLYSNGKNDPDEAAVKTMVPLPSSENLLKHKATGQLGGILFSKQTETAKPSLVKRIATAADEACRGCHQVLSAPPTDAYISSSPRTSRAVTIQGFGNCLKVSPRISMLAEEGKISLIMESEGLTMEGRYSVSPRDGRLAVTPGGKSSLTVPNFALDQS
ncbi:hypothetical protein QYE76_055260 [Lolium multiflorum]|uniref:Uncharacterized protein n=1 Tax=Lolium multiflorum TaxID=4521 RepID=A0AAD8T0R1_LOLMU|nr:hypothetical protein QYE76_055260 [Lolium multiflorum]